MSVSCSHESVPLVRPPRVWSAADGVTKTQPLTEVKTLICHLVQLWQLEVGSPQVLSRAIFGRGLGTKSLSVEFEDFFCKFAQNILHFLSYALACNNAREFTKYNVSKEWQRSVL